MTEEIDFFEVKNSLQSFVDAGVLIKYLKNGEWAYKNNPEFDNKTEEDQRIILDKIK